MTKRYTKEEGNNSLNACSEAEEAIRLMMEVGYESGSIRKNRNYGE